MKIDSKTSIVIKLSVAQFLGLGLHIGHTRRNSVFLAAWMFFFWRGNLFILNMLKTVLNMKVAVRAIRKTIRYRRPIWFISFHDYYGPLVSRYAVICGEPFNTYSWINGTLNNYRRIFGWHILLLRFMQMDKHLFRYMDKRKIAAFYGFLRHRRRIPGLGFFPSYFENIPAIEEFVMSNIISIGIVDSNVASGDLFIPLPGNDDSWSCVNFFIFLVAKIIYSRKLLNVNKWSKKVLTYAKLRFLRRKLTVLHFLKRRKLLKIELKPINKKFDIFMGRVHREVKVRDNRQNNILFNYTVNDTLMSSSRFQYFDNFKIYEDISI